VLLLLLLLLILMRPLLLLLLRLLVLAGASIQVAVFGSSLTQGYHKGSGFAETWAHEVQRWLQAAFPTADVDLINLARDATDVTAAAMCW
jgi:hypothetical protein